MNNIKLECTKEICTCDCETNKEKKNLCTYDKEDDKRKKLWMNVTIILVFMKMKKTSSSQRTNKQAHHWVISMKYPYSLETNITTCTKKLHSTHRTFRYWIIHINFWILINNLDYAKITNKTIRKRIKDNQSGNKYDENNNYEINTSVNSKRADKTQLNETTKTGAIKNKHLQTI